MRGWAELALCAAVLAACWTRTPVGALGQGAVSWALGEDADVDLLASFRTELPADLEGALQDAWAQPVAPSTHDGPWTPAVRLAIASHLGDAALAQIEALGLDEPEAAIETWAVGAEARRRAIERARAAGARHPERLAAHEAYLAQKDARSAKDAVSNTLSLATVLDLSWPVDPQTRVSSGFGYRHHPTLNRKKLHEGVDLAVPIGTPVHASGAARVARARSDDVNGQHVILDHGHRVTTAYCHGDALHVEKGDAVRQGQHILDSGNTGRSTGPHLHFGLRIGGRPVDPGGFRHVAPPEVEPGGTG